MAEDFAELLGALMTYFSKLRSQGTLGVVVLAPNKACLNPDIRVGGTTTVPRVQADQPQARLRLKSGEVS